MTSMTLDDPIGSTGAPTRAARVRPGSGLSFGGVLRSEWIKLSSLLSVRVTVLITLLMGIGLSALIALSWASMMGDEQSAAMLGTGAAADQSYLLMVATAGASFLALVFGVLGVFAIASEYSSGMILSTLAAVPRRSPVFAAKAVALSLISGIIALAIVVVGLLIAIAFYPEAAGELLSGTVLSGVLGTVGYLVLIALFSFGVAGILRSTAGGIAVVATVTFVLPIAFSMFSMTGWDWVNTVAQYLPMSLGNIIGQGAIETSSEPGFWLSLGSMVVWAAVTVVPAAILFKRRDAS